VSSPAATAPTMMSLSSALGPLGEYWTDAWQRWLLTLDVLRERGNIYFEHKSHPLPHVLGFSVELVMDGRKLAHPVNYGLVRVLPPPGTEPAPEMRPFVVFDPRAGHGPGIGGMKQESEVGLAMSAGHPCYFVGFAPEPIPGQTVEDVCRAEAAFMQEVASRHPKAEGKPAVIANCQAGWQVMMTAAIRPDLFGPIVLAGAPLSYWAGVRGGSPLRYLGGLLGGTWLTALAGDLGGGIFDGASLVANFESMNPANTLWKKPYNLYSKVDTEAARFLDFETWWGSPVLLEAREMQWIADNLFVGNKLASGEIRTSDGVRVDLRNIRSPIVVFCSWGDDITPPQQALGWITDLYAKDEEITANGQTIVYTLHESIGHLGIFVSGKVATKEHDQLINCMDLIDLLPPGLYEAVITEVDGETANRQLVHGRYLFSLEPRRLDDIRALGNNAPEDDLRFATAARLAEINLGLYRSMLAPVVRTMTTPQSAEATRALHPNRLRFAAFSDQNPAMAPIKALAQTVREQRRPVAHDNPLLAMERLGASAIASWLEGVGRARDMMSEAFFLATYGSPVLQALVGLGVGEAPTPLHMERDLLRDAVAAQLRSELVQRFEAGGVTEAVVRALIYVRGLDSGVDERGFALMKAIRTERPPAERIGFARFKELLREQALLMRLDPRRAVQAIPALLPRDSAQRRTALDIVRRMAGVRGALADEAKRRLGEVEAMFEAKGEAPVKAELANA
jgi:pimeloyl-ACP methyl ester carboxylesterase